jgi:hypothetical protein
LILTIDATEKLIYELQDGGKTLDKFENMMQMMSNMTEEERNKSIKASKKLCICPNCPTYNECAKEKIELLYCILGKSATCITKESGCVCPACPIIETMGLTKIYFCTKGTESQQRGTK